MAAPPPARLRWLGLAGALLFAVHGGVAAQGEHGRRAGAELRVLIGDLETLVHGNPSELHRKGLADRVAGGLSPLPLLLRLADQERGSATAALPAGELRDRLAREDYPGLLQRLEALSARYPLETSGFFDPPPLPAGTAAAAKTHAGLCAPCHDHPYTGVERPAWNLFEQAGRLEPVEFLARMLVGVRGDRVTAVENPFSDRELADLIALYRAGEAAVESESRKPLE